jgi:hypothetical protein
VNLISKKRDQLEEEEEKRPGARLRAPSRTAPGAARCNRTLPRCAPNRPPPRSPAHPGFRRGETTPLPLPPLPLSPCPRLDHQRVVVDAVHRARGKLPHPSFPLPLLLPPRAARPSGARHPYAVLPSAAPALACDPPPPCPSMRALQQWPSGAALALVMRPSGVAPWRGGLARQLPGAAPGVRPLRRGPSAWHPAWRFLARACPRPAQPLPRACPRSVLPCSGRSCPARSLVTVVTWPRRGPARLCPRCASRSPFAVSRAP